jgi:hypothetical protein
MAAVAFGQRPLTTSLLAAAAAATRRRKESEQERVIEYRVSVERQRTGSRADMR